jgi:hypothetical protein
MSLATSATGHQALTDPPSFQRSTLRASASPREPVPVLISPPTPSPNKEPTPPAFFASSRLRVSLFCGEMKPHAKNRPSTERVFCSNELAVLNACAG